MIARGESAHLPIERAVRGHMPVLDSLRGVAIAMVVVHNAGSLQTIAETRFLKAVLAVHGFGWSGVQLFFVLSGFLITGILLDTKGSPGFYGAFYARRALRIFPLYYALLFAWIVVLPRIAPEAAEAAGSNRFQVYYWTYSSNWVQPFGMEIPALTHFWSLAVEEQFYLVWPLCVALLAERSLGRLAAFMVIAALVFRVGLRAASMPHLTAYTFTFARMDALAIGAWLALAVRHPGWFSRIRSRMKPCAIALVVALLLVGGATHGFRFDSALLQTLGYSLLGLLCGILVLFAARETRETESTTTRSRLSRLLTTAPLRALGKYSYGIYVFHYPIIVLLRGRFETDVNHGSTAHRMLSLATFIALVSALSIMAAIASYQLMERHFLSLKRFFVALPKIPAPLYGVAPHSGND